MDPAKPTTNFYKMERGPKRTADKTAPGPDMFKRGVEPRASSGAPPPPSAPSAPEDAREECARRHSAELRARAEREEKIIARNAGAHDQAVAANGGAPKKCPRCGKDMRFFTALGWRCAWSCETRAGFTTETTETAEEDGNGKRK